MTIILLLATSGCFLAGLAIGLLFGDVAASYVERDSDDSTY